MAKDPAPGTWQDGHYTCSCDGCPYCSGHVQDCTCDVDWELLAEQSRYY